MSSPLSHSCLNRARLEQRVVACTCSEYTSKADSHHTTGRRHHHSRHGQVPGSPYHRSTDVPPTTTAPGGTAGAPPADDGSVSDSAMLFDQVTSRDAAGSKSSTTVAAASSKAGSGKQSVYQSINQSKNWNKVVQVGPNNKSWASAEISDRVELQWVLRTQ